MDVGMYYQARTPRGLAGRPDVAPRWGRFTRSNCVPLCISWLSIDSRPSIDGTLTHTDSTPRPLSLARQDTPSHARLR